MIVLFEGCHLHFCGPECNLPAVLFMFLDFGLQIPRVPVPYVGEPNRPRLFGKFHD